MLGLLPFLSKIMETWPFTHCLSLLYHQNCMLYDYWLSILWDDESDAYRVDALTVENLRILEADVMQQQAIG